MHPGVFVVPLVLLAVCAVLLFAMSTLVGFLTAAFRGPGAAGTGSAAGVNWPLLIMVIPVAILVVAAFVLVGIGYRSTKVQLTADRLRLKTGFMNRAEAEIDVIDIESVHLRRPPLGRLLGYGTVVIVAHGGAVFQLGFLPGPERLHQGLLKLRTPTDLSAAKRAPDSPAPNS